MSAKLITVFSVILFTHLILEKCMNNLENLKSVVMAFNATLSDKEKITMGINGNALNEMHSIDSDRLFFFMADPLSSHEVSRLTMQLAENELISLGRSRPDYDDNDLFELDKKIERVNLILKEPMDLRKLDEKSAKNLFTIIEADRVLSELRGSKRSVDRCEEAKRGLVAILGMEASEVPTMNYPAKEGEQIIERVISDWRIGQGQEVAEEHRSPYTLKLTVTGENAWFDVTENGGNPDNGLHGLIEIRNGRPAISLGISESQTDIHIESVSQTGLFVHPDSNDVPVDTDSSNHSDSHGMDFSGIMYKSYQNYMDNDDESHAPGM